MLMACVCVYVRGECLRKIRVAKGDGGVNLVKRLVCLRRDGRAGVRTDLIKLKLIIMKFRRN